MEPGISILAVQHLHTSMGDAGLSRLRMLFETDAVSNPTVRQRLNRVAEFQGWERDGGGWIIREPHAR